jgi:hypothetical protein
MLENFNLWQYAIVQLTQNCSVCIFQVYSFQFIYLMVVVVVIVVASAAAAVVVPNCDAVCFSLFI